jgi:hypothetical protein
MSNGKFFDEKIVILKRSNVIISLQMNCKILGPIRLSMSLAQIFPSSKHCPLLYLIFQ